MKKTSLKNSVPPSLITSTKGKDKTKSTKTGPDSPECLPRMINEPDVSLDEMLSLACRQGKLDIVKLLIQSGAKVNHRNKAGNTPLLECCSQGHVSVARFLLDNGAEIDAPTETTLDSPLTWACTLGNTEVVEELLKQKANVEHRTKDGCTALMFACLAGHEKVAEKLLDHKAEINVESDSNKDSPLTFACWKGHSQVVDLLLKRNANIEHRTKEGFSPLMFAALGGHTDVATKLLKQKAQVNVPSGSNNDIPLTSACWKGHHDVVKLLLSHSSNIEHRTKDGCTPLMLAAREGHLDVARLLLHHGAQVNVPSGSENNIPLTLACWKGHTEVVELLLQHSSDIEHRNKAGCTPLMLAAREGHYDTTKLLLENNAQVNVPSGSNDDTPLTLACWKGHSNVVELLIKYKSNVDHQTKTGCTPLMEATREGHKKDAEILLNHGADVELPDNYGQSPLFMACWKGHHAVADLLLERSANRDCRTKTGITPLFQACRENHVSIVELLLDYGASSTATFPNSRENPLTLAAEKGHKELVNLLLLRGANHDCHTKKGCSPLFLACKEGHKEIAELLYTSGADTEATDCRGNTPIMAAFRSGHVHVVEWLIKHTHHLPSDEICHKILMSAVDGKDKELLVQKRSKCLSLIQEAKKRKELQALKNAQSLVQEIDEEITREEKKKKKQAEKRRDKRRKKKSLRDMESSTNTAVENEPLENRIDECETEVCKITNNSDMKIDLNSTEDVLYDMDDEEVKVEKLQPYENREETEHNDVFLEHEEENVLKSQGKTTAGNTTVGDNNPSSQARGKKADREMILEETDVDENVFLNGTTSIDNKREQRLRASSSLPETELRLGFEENSAAHEQAAITVQPRRRSVSSAAEAKQSNEKWAHQKSEASVAQHNDACVKGILFVNKQSATSSTTSHNSAVSGKTASGAASANLKFHENDWKEVHRTSKTLIIQMTVPNSFCGRVIGKAGSKINSITDESGSQITVNKPDPQAPNDRLIIVKGSPSSVERARFLVTDALNSPSIFQNQGRNNITLGGFIDQKSLPSSSSSPPGQTSHTPVVPPTSDNTVKMPCSKSPTIAVVSPRSIASNTSTVNSSTAQEENNTFSYTPQPSPGCQSTSNRLSYSKIASGAWQGASAVKVINHQKQSPNAATTTFIASTQHQITSVPHSSHSVLSKLPNGLEENWDVTKFASVEKRLQNNAQGNEDTLVNGRTEPCLSSPAGHQMASELHTSPDAKSHGSPCHKVEEEAEFSYFSPWNPKIPDPGGSRTFPETSNNLENEGPLQSFSSLVKSSIFSRDIPPFPWQKADILRQDRSRSWAGRPTQLASDLHPISTGENENTSSLFGNRSVSTNGLSDKQTPGFKSPWKQQTNNTGAESNGDDVDDPVFIDKMPWIGDGTDRVSDSLLMSNTDTWEPSSSPTSSLSSSRQELNNILDNDSGVGGSNPWTQTPTSEHGASSQPVQEPSYPDSVLEASPWLSSRGAYSAPSSPALQRTNDNPFLSPNKQNLKSHPSMEELNSRLWGKGLVSQTQDNQPWSTGKSSSDSGRRFSQGTVAVNNDATQDSGVSSPRHNKISDSSNSGRINNNDPTLAKAAVWRQDRFESVTSLADLLASLSLEKYRAVLEKKNIDIETLSDISENELQQLGIAKGPRIKLMRAAKVVKESKVYDETQKVDIQTQMHQHQNENIIMMEQIHQGQQLQPMTTNASFIPAHIPHQHPHMQIPFPPGYEHLQQQRFNFVPSTIRPSHGMNENPAQTSFQPVEYVSHLPHNIGPIVPASVPQGQPFPFLYQESPAYFFYQQ